MSYNHTEICTMVSSQYSKTHGHTTVSTTLDKKVEHIFFGLPSSCGKKQFAHLHLRPYVLSRATDGSCRRSSSLLVSRCCWRYLRYPLFKRFGIDERTWQATLSLQRQPRTFLQNIAAILKTNHIGWFNDSTTKTFVISRIWHSFNYLSIILNHAAMIIKILLTTKERSTEYPS